MSVTWLLVRVPSALSWLSSWAWTISLLSREEAQRWDRSNSSHSPPIYLLSHLYLHSLSLQLGYHMGGQELRKLKVWLSLLLISWRALLGAPVASRRAVSPLTLWPPSLYLIGCSVSRAALRELVQAPEPPHQPWGRRGQIHSPSPPHPHPPPPPHRGVSTISSAAQGNSRE